MDHTVNKTPDDGVGKLDVLMKAVQFLAVHVRNTRAPPGSHSFVSRFFFYKPSEDSDGISVANVAALGTRSNLQPRPSAAPRPSVRPQLLVRPAPVLLLSSVCPGCSSDCCRTWPVWLQRHLNGNMSQSTLGNILKTKQQNHHTKTLIPFSRSPAAENKLG